MMLLRALKTQRPGCLCAFLALAIPGMWPLASFAEPAPFTFRTGVVVDPVGGVMYAQDPDARLTAIDLRTATERWRVDDACKPLAVLDGVLWAQVSAHDTATLSVVGFAVPDRREGDEGADGAALAHAGQPREAPQMVARLGVPLPEGALALLEDRPYQRFHVTVVRGDDALFLKWDYQQLADSRPLSPEAAPSGHRAEGILRLAPAAAGQPGSTAALTVADEQDLRRAQRAGLPAGLSSALDGHLVNPPALYSDNVWAAVERSAQGAREVATLKRWRATDGAPLPDVMIAESPATYRYPSADRRHLLVSAPAGDGRYTWRIGDVATGQTVLEVAQDRPGAWFFLFDKLLLVESFAAAEDATEGSLEMRAIDTDTGAQRWQYEIRDSAFRGAFPPVRPGDAGLHPPP